MKFLTAILTSFFICIASAVFAENYLAAKNIKCSGGKGSFADGKYSFTTEKNGVIYVNNIPTDKVGTLYRIKVGFTADKGMRIRSYMENSSTWQNSASQFITANGSQQFINYTFRPKKAVTKPSYIGINANGKGNIKITAVTVESEASETIAGNIMYPENITFSPKNCGKFENNCPVLTVKDAKSKAQLTFTQIETPSVDCTYHIEIEFTATPGMKLFSYIENSQGWQNAPGPRNIKTNGKKQIMRYTFRLKKAVTKPSYIVFTAHGVAGTVKIHKATVNGTLAAAIHDPDFSKDAQFWKLEKGAKVISDKNNKKLEISGEAVAVSPVFELKANTDYKITYDVQGIKEAGAKSMFSEYKIIPMYTQLTGGQYPMPGFSDVWVQTFSKGQKKFFTVKGSPKTTKVSLKIFVNPPATVRFDNFKLEALPQQKKYAEAELNMPHNRGIFSSAPADFVEGKIKNIAPEVKKITLVLKDSNNKVRLSQKRNISASVETFKIPAPLKTGTENLQITLADNNDKELAVLNLPVIRHAPNKSEVTFRKDGVTLVNGKPFFMIGHWWHTRRGDYKGKSVNCWYNDPADVDTDIKFLKEAGFNTVFLGHRRFKDIDIAHKNGMMAIIENRRINEKKSWQQEIAKYKDHPALLAYFGRDEAMVFGVMVDELMAETNMIKEVDPYHPLFHNEAPNGTMEEQKAYSVICDVIGRDIYPVGMTRHGHGDLVDKTMTVVGKHTDICMQSVDYNKPVWMILQSLSWGHINALNRMKPYEEVMSRYPTYAENRFMAYNAILHGATGIMYHYLGYTVHLPDSYWNALRKVTLELNYLSPVLTAETVKNPSVKCLNKQVRFMVKKYEGRNYYFIINESAEAVTAIFKNIPESKLNQLFEVIPLYVNNGSFTLDLPAYGTAVLSEADFKSAAEIYKPATYVPYSKQPALK
ncbi:MAG: hypothetical protein IKA22_13880 [Lentisphaeria bacterium]|nr:hypothetical protein [Lentisphaeria bacterium]